MATLAEIEEYGRNLKAIGDKGDEIAKGAAQIIELLTSAFRLFMSEKKYADPEQAFDKLLIRTQRAQRRNAPPSPTESKLLERAQEHNASRNAK
jgi:hypothetical protein